ncbi:DUF6069 family protein [Halorientalis marina]|uniref:DUF6069 family protein n=1 Tax=Halorientalis marina TaxID=2931976 RepID=UPI001FF436E4|nr:DUF6069 family protein [Halorientalis marina]
MIAEPTTTTTTDVESSADLRTGSAIARIAARTVVALLVVNLLLRGLGAAVVPALSSFEPLGWGAVIATSVVVGLGAVAAGAVVIRITDRARPVFVTLAFVAVLVSLVPVVTVVPTFPGVTSGIQAIMIAMHVISAGVVVWLFRPSL